jgi:hypothetical protein
VYGAQGVRYVAFHTHRGRGMSCACWQERAICLAWCRFAAAFPPNCRATNGTTARSRSSSGDDRGSVRRLPVCLQALLPPRPSAQYPPHTRAAAAAAAASCCITWPSSSRRPFLRPVTLPATSPHQLANCIVMTRFCRLGFALENAHDNGFQREQNLVFRRV